MVAWVLGVSLALTGSAALGLMVAGARLGLIAQVIVGGVMFSMFAGIVLPGIVYHVAHPELEDYGLPACPGAGLVHYEFSLSWKSDTVARHQFVAKGWQNITVEPKADGGFFGGSTDYMAGDCNLKEASHV